ncbi:MAG: CinA family protein [Chakrabartia sp.]
MAETLSPVLSTLSEQRASAVLAHLAERQESVATAESCTGGLLSALFTDVPGFSHVFVAGYIAYAEAAKSRMLGISDAQIRTYGAVSAQIAAEMARAARRQSDSDWSLAVTGFAGPAGPGEEPGLVHFACAGPHGLFATAEHHFGDVGRGETRRLCLEAGVELLHNLMACSSGVGQP